eukprot:scaffold187200_cov33-Tisochrysis_lutea.AAC.4
MWRSYSWRAERPHGQMPNSTARWIERNESTCSAARTSVSSEGMRWTTWTSRMTTLRIEEAMTPSITATREPACVEMWLRDAHSERMSGAR